MLCHNTYGYSLLFYKVYHEEGECRQLEFWLEREQILETYSALLQKTWNSTKVILGNNKKYWAEEVHQGGLHLATRVGARPTRLGTLPCLVGPLTLHRPQPWLHIFTFGEKKPGRIIHHVLRYGAAAKP